MTASVQTQWISVPSTDGAAFDAYLALPPAGKGPGIVLCQEIFGVNAHIRDVADQWALAGFVVLAPDVFWRQERRVELGYDGADREKALGLMKGMDLGAIERDVLACVKALKGRSETAGHKIGVMGYCLGGRLAYLAATSGDADVAATVSYYGGGIHTALDRAPKARCPMLLHYGQTDPSIPMDAIAQVKSALAPLGAEVHVYPGAGHAFNRWSGSPYHPASAALALGRSLTFFATHLF